MEKKEKQLLVTEFQQIFKSSLFGILIDYKGLVANDLVELRHKLFKAKSNLKVLKNSLAKLAVKDTPFSVIKEQFVETRAIIFSKDDPVEQAKILVEISEKNKNLKILSGIMIDVKKTSILSEEQVLELSKLPSKEELLVKFLFLLQSPTLGFLRTLNEVPSKLLRTFNALIEKNK